MIAGILRESGAEKRVALLPGETAAVIKLGLKVIVEEGAGIGAYATDEEYRSAGASVASRKEVVTGADLLFTVNPPVLDDISLFPEGQILFTVLDPTTNRGWLEQARNRGLTVLALDLVPRITRAQSMDILSSMATVAGYKAVLEAASMLPRFFPDVHVGCRHNQTCKGAHPWCRCGGTAGYSGITQAWSSGGGV
jgi:H+-translocating NAD(P) transhydrogenase subunit alpha